MYRKIRGLSRNLEHIHIYWYTYIGIHWLASHVARVCTWLYMSGTLCKCHGHRQSGVGSGARVFSSSPLHHINLRARAVWCNLRRANVWPDISRVCVVQWILREFNRSRSCVHGKTPSCGNRMHFIWNITSIFYIVNKYPARMNLVIRKCWVNLLQKKKKKKRKIVLFAICLLRILFVFSQNLLTRCNPQDSDK